MVRRERKRKSFLIVVVFLLVIGFTGVFFGMQYLKKTGIFKQVGTITYDDSLIESEKDFLKKYFTEDFEVSNNLTISAFETTDISSLESNELVYEVNVPIADFYDTRSDISDLSEEEYEFVPLDQLDHSMKLLSINGDYYLKDFTKGARFRVMKFDSDGFDSEIKPIIYKEFAGLSPSKDTVLTFAQTGVTAFSREMNNKLAQVGGDATFFVENIREYLSSFDLTHTSNESSFSDSANSNNICSDKRFIDALLAIGLDIVELTGNHNLDCGADDAIDTIDVYNSNNIKIVGGGKNATEANKPLNLNEKGNNITMLAYNQSTGGATYDDTPGANQYYEDDAATNIAAAKERGDLVIVDIQYYECSAYASASEDDTCDYANSSAGDQVSFFRHLIDLGADVVVGTSAHQPQTFETYGNGVIYYGLGNLFFDQVWWPGTTRSLVLEHYIYKNRILQTRITPTVYDNNMQTRLMDEEDAVSFLNRLTRVHP